VLSECDFFGKSEINSQGRNVWLLTEKEKKKKEVGQASLKKERRDKREMETGN
jgi:hypothetical protein